MAYLSKIWLNPLRARAQVLLGNPQAMHAAVLGGVSRQPITERVLWRVENDSRHRAAVLVLTASSPSWEHLVEQAGWPSSEDPQALVRPYQPLLDRVQRGREFAFRLRANPVMATRAPLQPSAAQRRRLEATRPRGVRVPLRRPADQLAWLNDRAGRWGFDLPRTEAGDLDLRLAARERVVFSREAARVTIETVTFEGRLQITDPELARTSLLGGVGSARAYGCGLITLAPLPGSG